MGLTEKVNAGIAAAMKAKDAGRLSALRMVKAAIMNKGVEKGATSRTPKSSRSSRASSSSDETPSSSSRKPDVPISSTRKPPRLPSSPEFLPPAATPEEIDTASRRGHRGNGATSAKDVGKVMKAVMPKLAGKNADGRTINEAVRRKLGA